MLLGLKVIFIIEEEIVILNWVIGGGMFVVLNVVSLMVGLLMIVMVLLL